MATSGRCATTPHDRTRYAPSVKPATPLAAILFMLLGAALLTVPGCGEREAPTALTHVSDIRDVRAKRIEGGELGGNTTGRVPDTPLPVGVWAVADPEAAKVRLRPHYEKMAPHEREENERSLRASVVEFRADGSARLRVYGPWVMPGAWNPKGHEIVLRVIQGREATELTETTFRTLGERLFVVSLGEEIELKRVAWE